MKRIEKIHTSTVIYFTTIIALFALQFLVGEISTKTSVYIILITTLPYIVLTKRYYIITPFISFFMLAGTISSLPAAIYSVTGKEPSFIIASSLLAFFITLFIGNIVSHAEWSIRSPWVANSLGLVGLYVVEFALMTTQLTTSPVLVGVAGLLMHLIISTIFLTVGKYIFVNEPKTKAPSSSYLSLTEEMSNSAYDSIETLNASKTETKLSSKSKDIGQVRLYYTDIKVSHTEDNKRFIKNFFTWKNGKKTYIYSWLLQEATKSYEAKTSKGVKKEQFIIVQENSDINNSFYDIIELPIKRSNKKMYIGVFTLGSKVNKKTINNFNELCVKLKLKTEEF